MRLTLSLLLALSLFSASLLAFFPASLRAQIRRPPAVSPAQAEQERQTLLAQAAALLDEAIAESAGLRLPENRAYVQARSAGLLWKRDEPRARELLRQAQAQLAELMAQLTPADPQYHQQLNSVRNLRGVIFEIWGEHDTKLALEFLRASRLTTTAAGNHTGYNPEREMELQLAARIAAVDPQLALQTAEESLKDGVSYQLVGVFQNLQGKDPQAADKLLGKIVSQLKPADFLKDYNAASIAGNLLQYLNSRTAEETAPEQATRAEELKRMQELLELLIATTLKLTANNFLAEQESGLARNLLMQVQQLLPIIEKRLPGRLPALRAKLAQFSQVSYQQRNPYEAYQVATRSAEELTALAAKAPLEVRNYLYGEAANKALAQGAHEQARQLLKEHVSDPQQREQMLSNLDRQLIAQAGNAGKYDEAKTHLTRLPSEAERISYLTQWATQAAAKGDEKLARRFLEEAGNLLGAGFETRQKLEAQLQIAQAYAQFEHSRSFELLEAALARLNPLLTAYAAISSYEQNGQFTEGEGRLLNGEAQSLSYNFGAPLSLLVRKDFNRTKELIKGWEAKEVRVHYYLALAQELFSLQPEHFERRSQLRSLPISGRRFIRLH